VNSEKTAFSSELKGSPSLLTRRVKAFFFERKLKGKTCSSLTWIAFLWIRTSSADTKCLIVGIRNFAVGISIGPPKRQIERVIKDSQLWNPDL
jgi:hypothetical protein